MSKLKIGVCGAISASMWINTIPSGPKAVAIVNRGANLEGDGSLILEGTAEKFYRFAFGPGKFSETAITSSEDRDEESGQPWIVAFRKPLEQANSGEKPDRRGMARRSKDRAQSPFLCIRRGAR